MQRLLFTAQFKPGGLEIFKKFIRTITTQKVKEYDTFLKRYGMHSAKSWFLTINGIDFGFLFHEAENDAMERLKHFEASKHPFDLWFAEQLKDCFAKGWEPNHLIFEYDVSNGN